MEYFILLLIVFIFTLVLEKTQHIHLYRNRQERLEIVLIFFIVGVLWDSFAVYRGHWVFPKNMTLGITVGLLPLEEYLFFLIIPYFILTIYRYIDSKFRKRKFR